MRQTVQERAGEYRSKAQVATTLAVASVLAQVRERHEAAAFAWTELAETEERRAFDLGQRFGRAALAQSTGAAALDTEAACSA